MGNLSDLELRILRLLELISNTNNAIARNSERGEEGRSTVEQYAELKCRYEQELYEVLTVEMGIRFPAMALAA